MKERAFLLISGGILFFVMLSFIGLALVNTNIEQLASNLANRVAIVTDLEDILVDTNYDETFLDPHDNAVKITGESWRGSTEIHQRADPYVHLLALTKAGSKLEVDCTKPTSSVGIQFWGDSNDGWAEIVVDDDFVLQRDNENPKEYVEFTDLPLTAHTIRIEALGRAEDGPNVHVTVTGISCQQRGHGLSRLQRIFLPLILR